MIEFLLLASIFWLGPGEPIPNNCGREAEIIVTGCYFHDSHDIYISDNSRDKSVTLYHEYGHHLFIGHDGIDKLFNGDESVAKLFALHMSHIQRGERDRFARLWPLEVNFFRTYCDPACEQFILSVPVPEKTVIN